MSGIKKLGLLTRCLIPIPTAVQFLFMVYALVYSNHIFEIAHEPTCPKKSINK
jgi:hypothetical protein